MTDRLRELKKDAFDRLRGEERWHRAIAEAQVDQLMEHQWVAVPITQGYEEARERAERLLAARKNTRCWQRPGWEQRPGQPKSSLDGDRESVLDDTIYRKPGEGGLSPEERRRRYRIAGAERLCGVGLLKRLGEDEDEQGRHPPFHSAAHIAAGPLRTRLTRLAREDRDLQTALRAYVKDVLGVEHGVDLERFQIWSGRRAYAEVQDPLRDDAPKGPVLRVPRTLLQEGEQGDGPAPRRSWRGYDAALLLPEQLPAIFEEASSYGLDLERLRHASGALDGLLRQRIGLHRPPCPYYALLQADGDRMGKAIRDLGSEEHHQRLARALHHFAQGKSSEAKSALRIIEGHGGSPVYLGGDDVLALLPLHTALRCADELRLHFSECLKDLFQSPARPPTLSVGLGVVHYQESLGAARSLAKRAEELAKVRRDSLGIVVSKRSGGTLGCAAPWDADLRGRLDRWCRLFQRQQLPEGVAFDLEQAAGPLLIRGPSGGAEGPESLDEVARAQARRILARKRRDGGQDEIDQDEVAKGVHEALARHMEAIRDGDLERHGAVRPQVGARALLALSEELQIARVFLLAYEDAWKEEVT